MRTRHHILSTLLVVAAITWQSQAQDFEYRFSLVEEGTLNTVNADSPFNYQNQIHPQSKRSNMFTSSLFLNYGSMTTALNLTALADNIRKPLYQFALRELFFDIPLTDKVDVTVGKKILKWGTGYAFNPTGVVEPQRTPSDPSDRLGQNDGRKLIAVNAFSGKSTLTLVYLNDVRFESSRWIWGKQQFAVRAYTFLNGLDLSLVAHYREGDRLEAGLNWSYVVGSSLELHGEVLAKKGSSALYHPAVKVDDLKQIYSSDPSAPLEENSGRVFGKLLLGGQYTFENGANVAVEFYHNSEGLNKSEWNQWMKFVKFHNDIQRGFVAEAPILIELSRYNLLWALQTLSSRGTMSDYLFGRVYYATGNSSFEILGLFNILDASAVAVSSVSFRISENFSLYGRWTSFMGASDSEYGALFSTQVLNLGIRFQL